MAVQAQCILFKRCSEDLAPFKYAGYPMLLQAISLPDDDGGADGTTQRPPTAHFLGDEIAPRLMVRHSGGCLTLHGFCRILTCEPMLTTESSACAACTQERG